MTDQRVDEADKPHADPAPLHDQPGEDEKGNREKNVIPGAGDHGLRQDDQRRRAARPQIGGGGQQQDKSDRNTGEYRREKETERGDDRGIVAQSRQPCAISRRRERRRSKKKRGDDERQSPMFAPDARGRVERHQGHADRKRECDQRGRRLQDRRALSPACGDELDRGDADQPADEEDDDVGERKADSLDRSRDEVENEADLRVVAPPIGHGAADERQDRQHQAGDLVRPQE